jgi:hypothetical protein
MAYAAGAVAAGAAGTQSADAAVVYSPGFSFAVNDTKPINFDNTGVEEFNLGHERNNNNPSTDRVILKDPTTGGSEAYTINPEVTGNTLIAPVPLGTRLGPDESTFYGNAFNSNVGNRIVDEDSNDDNIVDGSDENQPPIRTNFAIDNVVGNPEYFGVRFKLNNTGDDYYGWIGIDITNADDLTGVVTGFAYEDGSEGDLHIEVGAVPEPSSGLALLALGAAGMLRRKR